MISIQTKLKVKDNTGIKKVQCIKIFNKTSSLGNIILISIKEIKKNLKKKIKIKKGNIFKALIVQTKYNNKNTIGHYLSYSENSVILLNNKEEPIGSRIFGPISTQFRLKKKLKIISLASYII